MKKVRSLQILVYVVFGLLMIKTAIPGLIAGFNEGFNDVTKLSDSSFREGPLLHATLDGIYLTKSVNNKLTVGDNYLLENVVIQSDVRVNSKKINMPYFAIGTTVVLILCMLVIMVKIAYNTNCVIGRIAAGSMFDWDCIQIIRATAMLMLLYTFIDFAQQQIYYYQETLQIHAPLRAINTSEFDLGTLIMAILVFILAEAFKQGAKLKEEQSLVI